MDTGFHTSDEETTESICVAPLSPSHLLHTHTSAGQMGWPA